MDMGLKRFPRMKFITNRERYLTNMCRDKVVLHLGCADAIYLDEHIQKDRHLHLLINSVAKEAHGVDIDGSAIEKLRERHSLPNLHVGDIENLNLDFGTAFDVIVAGELIEHLNNPGLLLGSASR